MYCLCIRVQTNKIKSRLGLFVWLTALPTHQDERVGFPVGRGDLVGEPGGDCFSRFDAELGH